MAFARAHPALLQGFATWSVTRLGLAVMQVAAVALRPSGNAAFAAPFDGNALLAQWQNWDAVWFLGIAAHGYTNAMTTVYFPLYPTLVRGVALLIGMNHLLIAGLIVSNLAALAVCCLLPVVLRETPHAWLILFTAPMAFFLAAPYSDSVFLALALATIALALHRAWGWCVLTLTLAACTRITAIILIAPVFLLYAQTRGWGKILRMAWQHRHWGRVWWREHVTMPRNIADWRHALVTPLALICAVPVSLGAYAIWCLTRFGVTPWTEEQLGWHHTLLWPWQTATLVVQRATTFPLNSFVMARSLIDIVPFLVATGVTLAAWRHWTPAWRAYMVGLLMMCVAAPVDITGSYLPLVSVGRYLLVAFPVIAAITGWLERHPQAMSLWVSASILIQAAVANLYLANLMRAWGVT